MSVKISKGYIKRHPIIEFKRGRLVWFKFEGKRYQGYEGEPIAAALHANGIMVLSYSIRYNRPRGFFCAVGKCASCLMEVDGRENVMVCMEPLKEGMEIRRQRR